MKSLLIKDLYTLAKQLRIFLLLILVFALWPDGGMAGFAVVYAGLLPLTAMAYDEQAKWDQLAATMPYTTLQLVAGKYALGYGFVLATTLLSMVSRGLLVQFTGGELDMVLYAGMVLMALLLIVVSLPVLFRFGVEKGRLVFFFLVMAAAAGGYVILEKAAWVMDLFRHVGVCIVLILLLSAASLFLSCGFYRKRAW